MSEADELMRHALGSALELLEEIEATDPAWITEETPVAAGFWMTLAQLREARKAVA